MMEAASSQAAPALDLKSDVSLSPGDSARTYRDRTARGGSPFGDAPDSAPLPARLRIGKSIVKIKASSIGIVLVQRFRL